MKEPYDRLPECGELYLYGRQWLVCRRAEGHGGNHRVSREAWGDEKRIRRRLEQDEQAIADAAAAPERSSGTDQREEEE